MNLEDLKADVALAKEGDTVGYSISFKDMDILFDKPAALENVRYGDAANLKQLSDATSVWIADMIASGAKESAQGLAALKDTIDRLQKACEILEAEP